MAEPAAKTLRISVDDKPLPGSDGKKFYAHAHLADGRVGDLHSNELRDGLDESQELMLARLLVVKYASECDDQTHRTIREKLDGKELDVRPDVSVVGVG